MKITLMHGVNALTFHLTGKKSVPPLYLMYRMFNKFDHFTLIYPHNTHTHTPANFPKPFTVFTAYFHDV